MISGSVLIKGSKRSDTIFGTPSGDAISPDRGNDVVFAGDGDDVITFYRGNDTYTLGAGLDVVQMQADSRGTFEITDFRSMEDRLDLSALGTFDSLRLDGTLGATGASELSVWHSETVSRLLVDRNGDGQAEITATLNGTFDLWGDLVADIALPPAPSPNVTPVANPDRSTGFEGQSQTIDVLANDTDSDGDALSIESVGAAEHGGVSVTQAGVVSYVPDEGFTGIDSFIYTVTDDYGATSSAVVEITVEQTPTSPDGPASPLAFAGADGFGMYAVGGRNGEILKVTNLDDSGPGSLRWALEDVEGPRFVVFEVGGVIQLNQEIRISDPFVTIAGQTAPGDGITLSGARIKVNADEVIVRGLKIRPGDGAEGQEFSSRDGISLGGGSTSDPIRNIIVDHNSFTWATDENAAIWGNVSNVTFSNNIIAQSLETPTEPGRASMGMIASGGEISQVTIARNLFAHNEDRNPYFRDVDHVEIVNNYVYNYGDSGMRLSNTITANVVGNVFEAGVNSPDRAPLYLSDGGEGQSRYYLHDNVWEKDGTRYSGADVAHTSTQYIVPVAVFESGVDAIGSDAVKDYVLDNAGARSQSRDEIDAYLVETARRGTGSSIDTLEESPVGLDLGTAATAGRDSDNDGMPDWFEDLYDPFDTHRFDAHEDADGDGYTNIEEYVNGLISGFDLD